MQVSAFWSDTAGQGQDFERFDEETGRLGRSKPEVGLGEATDAGEDEPATLRQRTYGLLDLSAQVAGWGQPQREGVQVKDLRESAAATPALDDQLRIVAWDQTTCHKPLCNSYESVCQQPNEEEAPGALRISSSAW